MRQRGALLACIAALAVLGGVLSVSAAPATEGSSDARALPVEVGSSAGSPQAPGAIHYPLAGPIAIDMSKVTAWPAGGRDRVAAQGGVREDDPRFYRPPGFKGPRPKPVYEPSADSGDAGNPQARSLGKRTLAFQPGFEGLGQRKNKQIGSPTDSAVAIDPRPGGKGMVAVNSAIQVFALDAQTGVMAGTPLKTVTLEAFLAPVLARSGTQEQSDPNLAFDDDSGRFFFNVLIYKTNTTKNSFGYYALGVSATSDPLGKWNFYILRVDGRGLLSSYKEKVGCAPDDTGIADYPQMFPNKDAVLVSGMLFCDKIGESPFLAVIPKATVVAGRPISTGYAVFGAGEVANSVLPKGAEKDKFGDLSSWSYAHFFPVRTGSPEDKGYLGAIYPKTSAYKAYAGAPLSAGAVAHANGAAFFVSQDVSDTRQQKSYTVGAIVNTRTLSYAPNGSKLRLVAATIGKGVNTVVYKDNYSGGVILMQPNRTEMCGYLKKSFTKVNDIGLCPSLDGGDFIRSYGGAFAGNTLVVSSTAEVGNFPDRFVRAGQWYMFLEPRFVTAAKTGTKTSANLSTLPALGASGLVLRRFSSGVLTQRTPYPLGLAFATVGFLRPDLRTDGASVAIAYTASDNSSVQAYPSAAYSLFRADGTVIPGSNGSPVRIAARGNGPILNYSRKVVNNTVTYFDRMGDYAGASFDLKTGRMWAALTYAQAEMNMSATVPRDRYSRIGQWVAVI